MSTLERIDTTMAETNVKAHEKETGQVPQPQQQKAKREPKPGYSHLDHHVEEYERLGIDSEDTDIGRAWARLYDAGHNAGPAVSKAYMAHDGRERQLFQYAWAERDTGAGNINHTVVFHFGGHVVLSESGLGHELKREDQ